MDRLDSCVVGLIDEVDHDHCVVISNEEDVGCRARCDLHSLDTAVELDALDYLVQFEVANKHIV